MEKKKKEKKEAEEAQKTEEKNGEVEKLQKRIEELENQIKRTLADYQNLEKRTREREREVILSANKQLILRILPILDTLQMVAIHLKDQGLELTIKQFADTLKAEGIEKIETVGKDFDPYVMEAVETVPGEKHKVIEETQAGYTLYDKVLRPARVKVGKGSD